MVGGRDLITEDSVPTSHCLATSLTVRNLNQIQTDKIGKSKITASDVEERWEGSCCEESCIKEEVGWATGQPPQEPNEKLGAKHNCLIRLTNPPLESRSFISFIAQVIKFDRDLDLTICHFSEYIS